MTNRYRKCRIKPLLINILKEDSFCSTIYSLTEHYAHFCIVIFLHINKEKSTKKESNMGHKDKKVKILSKLIEVYKEKSIFASYL